MIRSDFSKNWMWGTDGQTKSATDLPHDAMQYEERHADAKSGGGGAFYEGGVYEYEKTLTVPSDWKGRHTELQFEGVYCNSTVYVNGTKAASCVYGYAPFFVDLDPYLNFGSDNTILVKVKNDQMPNTRWYSGSGIYRPVWLWQGSAAYLKPEGIRVRTLDIHPAQLSVTLDTVGSFDRAVVRIFDGDQLLSETEGTDVTVTLPDAKLWSEETPSLYRCTAQLYQGDVLLDEAETLFGIRKLTWSTDGFFVNGKSTLLRGGCVHHDNGVIGARSYGESEWRRVERLKKAGFNAIRVSHNPASEQMLAACDYYGMYVMDEGWDMWYKHKNQYDYASEFMAHYQDDIKAMVARDFNHPSVILYSIGNEVSEPASAKGMELANEIISQFHALDPDRPVTGGMNLMIISRSADGDDIYKEEGGRNEEDDQKTQKTKEMNSMMFNIMTSMIGSGMNKAANGKKADLVTTPILDALDIAGYNYASGRYPLEAKAHPNRIIFGSETFPQDIAKNWKMVKKYPYLIGDFMWTAWDYIGETGAGAWAYTKDGQGFEKPFPWLLADMGALDLLGHPNGELFFANAAWEQLEKPVICVQPVNHPGVKPFRSSWRGTNAIQSWSWSGCEGNKAIVEVYSNADTVTLYKNKRKIGKKRCRDGKAVFKTKYEPGRLDVIAETKGEQKRAQLISAEGNLKITARAEKKRYAADNIHYISIDITDQRGIIESNADATLSVIVENGTLIGFGSANPRTTESYASGTYTTYYGRSQAVVRVEPGQTAVLSVHSDVLGDAELQIRG